MNIKIQFLDMFPDYQPPEALQDVLSQAAITAATDGQTIVLLRDFRLNGTVAPKIAKKVTLDLNGHKVNGNGVAVEVRKNGELTIKSSVDGGEISGPNYGVEIWGGGTVTIESGTVSGPGYTGVAVEVGTLNILGGTVTGKHGVAVGVGAGVEVATGVAVGSLPGVAVGAVVGATVGACVGTGVGVASCTNALIYG